MSNFKLLSATVLDRMQSVTHGHMDARTQGRTGQDQYASSTSLLGASLTICHLKCNAHSIFPLFPEIFSDVIFFFQKCNPPDFKFYLVKLTNKIFPHMV